MMGHQMQLVDTHSHVFVEEFDDDRDTVIARSVEAGVGKILLPNLDDRSIDAVLSLADAYPDACFPMLGMHPSYIKADYKERLSEVKAALDIHHGRCVGIGEIGLDYYWSLEYKEEMNDALRTQLEWALEYDLPVSLHARDAIPDTVKAIRDVGADRLRGVFHSFTGNIEELEAVLELPHFYVGINGVVTFKNNDLKTFIPDRLPLDRLIIETDAPYLAPMPKRGKRNEPAYLVYIYEYLTALYGVSPTTMREKLFANSCNLYNFTVR
ncbi:TatD family hydrolase [Porphyromonas sp.]|uniref:TatD family hydrolase n=1 Tax=Porphyromonas sp. TaxID=1924944 RepID=UPI0026DAF9FA|nr:TatD family hydrolase [Porphyromonas sp.]MDO4695474.1 TatD family hydrolase [Porphyromonas sp.]MDO4770292.1 TatD family hydrolase [Porphyromonas sp.]